MAQPGFWYLRRLHADDRLPSSAREALSDIGRLERWGHQAEIYREPADTSVSIVIKGQVWLQDLERGQRVGLLRGDLFGRVAAADGTATSALRAHDDTLLAVLEREAFAEQIVPYLGNLSTRVGRFRKRRDLWVPVQPLLFTAPSARMAKVLLHLVETQGVIDEEGYARLAVKLEARNLAALTGVDPGRVRKVLESLEVAQILERGNAELFIRDLDTLRQVAREG